MDEYLNRQATAGERQANTVTREPLEWSILDDHRAGALEPVRVCDLGEQHWSYDDGSSATVTLLRRGAGGEWVIVGEIARGEARMIAGAGHELMLVQHEARVARARVEELTNRHELGPLREHAESLGYRLVRDEPFAFARPPRGHGSTARWRIVRTLEETDSGDDWVALYRSVQR